MMKGAPDIDFVRSRGRGLAWASAALLIVGVALAGVSYLAYRTEQRGLDAAIGVVQQQLSAPQTTQPAQAPRTDPAWLKEAEASVAEDWNRLFDRIEGLKGPSVRLVSVQAGLHPRSVRVEFELDAWPRVAELNAELNQSKQNARWDLMSVGATSGGAGVRAVWSLQGQ